jgi:GDP-L-fucose synthase
MGGFPVIQDMMISTSVGDGGFHSLVRRSAPPRAQEPEDSGMSVISRDSVVHVAGHRGLVGSAVWRRLVTEGFTGLIGESSTALDLRDRVAVDAYYDDHRPDYVILAAARVGGILANATMPAEFLSDNLRIQVNVLDAAARVGVKKLLFLGSSCIYPKFAEQPISERALLTGTLEPTNDAYAIAKIAGILHVQALRRQYGLPYISAMPTNLYGPGDNFDPLSSHVLPALIRRFHEARATGQSRVTLWGTGTPRREFLHVDDLARACLTLLERYDEPEPINVGVGVDLTIAELAAEVARVVGWQGDIDWDPAKPDGTPRKLLNVERINALGWKAEISLPEGLVRTYDAFLDHAYAVVPA